MADMKALGRSAVLAALVLMPAVPAHAFDPPQRLQTEQDWNEEPAEDATPYDDEAETETPAGDADDEAPSGTGGVEASSSAEDAAVDACAVAAEREATIDGTRGRVRAIGQVQQTGGGWEVEGVVETGRGLMGLFRDETLFTCFARGGRVENVRIEDAPDKG